MKNSTRAETLALPVLQSESIDREVRRLFMQLSPIRLMSIKNTPVASVRRSWQLCVKAFASREPVAAVVEKEVPTADGALKVRIYSPSPLAKDELQPALVWFHGGGFVFGDLYTAGATCRQLANRCGCAVIAVEYRLAPESSLQDGLSDCEEAFRWAATQASELGIDADRVAIGGDSAGGALAALTTSYARPRTHTDGDNDDMIVVTNVFSNGSASLVDVVQPPRNKRMLDEFESALRQDAAFVPASLDRRPDTMRVVFAVQKVDVNDRNF